MSQPPKPERYGVIGIDYIHMSNQPVVAITRTNDTGNGIILTPEEWTEFLTAIREAQR